MTTSRKKLAVVIEIMIILSVLLLSLISRPTQPLTYTLTIADTVGGTTDPEPGSHQFEDGKVVNVTAIPEKNFVLDHWELDGVNQAPTNSIDLTMNAKHILVAVFKPLYTLTIASALGGTTDPPPSTYQHKEGTVVEVAAVPYGGYVLDRWRLDGSPVGRTNPKTILMDSDHELEAIFQIPFTLTIVTTGGGTTHPAPGAHIYPPETNVSVTAIPHEGHYFAHWVLDSSNVSSDDRIFVVMDKDYDLFAVFIEVPSPPVGGYARLIEKTHLLTQRIDSIMEMGTLFVLMVALAAASILIKSRNENSSGHSKSSEA